MVLTEPTVKRLSFVSVEVKYATEDPMIVIPANAAIERMPTFFLFLISINFLSPFPFSYDLPCQKGRAQQPEISSDE